MVRIYKSPLTTYCLGDRRFTFKVCIQYSKKAVADYGAAVKKAATKLIRRSGPVGVATTLYDFYKRGQEKSGGKVRKNKNLFKQTQKRKQED